MVANENVGSEPSNDALVEGRYDEETITESFSGADGGFHKHSMDIEKTTKRTMWVALLVVLVGVVASASFLYMGISNEKNSNNENFHKRSTDMAKEIQGAMNDYELACSWIHESCRNWREDGFTYRNFRDLHEYIAGGGLDFYAMEW